MSARVAWKQVAKRLAEEAALQQQGATASLDDLRKAADQFMYEAVKWWCEMDERTEAIMRAEGAEEALAAQRLPHSPARAPRRGQVGQ